MTPQNAKKSYASIQLRPLGSLARLTKQGGSNRGDGMGGMRT
jgi:hypothetical protein